MYDVSSDVHWHVELQDSRNWGSTIGGGDANNLGANQNDVHGEALGVREAYIVVKNAGIQNMSLKLGRQKVVVSAADCVEFALVVRVGEEHLVEIATRRSRGGVSVVRKPSPRTAAAPTSAPGLSC